jgi:uncharacterized cupin superfamily protein
MSKPDFIKHYTQVQEAPNSSFYRGSSEFLSDGAPIGKALGLTKLGIHHETLLPGRRTSWPHAESAEEEFGFVIEGYPDVWINGHLHRLSPGDAVGFPSGTGICHAFINNTDSVVRLLIVGEKTKSENKIYYPLHPERKIQIDEDARTKGIESTWWNDVPRHEMGPHDGLPDLLRQKISK